MDPTVPDTPAPPPGGRPAGSSAGSPELQPDQLRWRLDPADLPFERTSELPPSREIIGQERALRAIRLGLSMESPGYNVFLTGFVGTGRNTTIRHVLDRFDQGAKPPPDLAYVHDFDDPDRPRAMLLPAGWGSRLVRRMEEVLRHLDREIPAAFEGKIHRDRRERIHERYRGQQRQVIGELEKTLAADEFALVQIQTGPTMSPQVVPVIDGEPRFVADLEEAVDEGKLTEERLEQIREKTRKHARELQDVVRETLKLENEMQDRLQDHDRASLRPVVSACFELVREEFSSHQEVLAWFKRMERHVVENVSTFLPDEEEDATESRTHYQVNLLVDNAEQKGAPVVLENTPTLGQLFGWVERRFSSDSEEIADHLRIKAGSLHRANGGYLVLNATDLFSESAGVWNTLKRALRSGSLEIPAPEAPTMLGPPALKPRPVPIRVKVLLVGDAHTYSLLHAYDEDFRKIFKVRADFDTEMENTPETRLLYGGFVQRLVDEEQVRVFHRNAVARVVEHGVRLAGRRNKLSTRFHLIADLVREAGHFAGQAGRDVVAEEDVALALEEREYRNSLAMERMQEMIEEGSVFIDTEGHRIGSVNGLAVYESGEHAFGLPTRITASIGLGNAGIINIEREAELSGNTHDKGVQILGGYLRSKYAQERPLTLSASVCFEQSYHGVDGDSASSTELYAVLSALSDVPIRQDIAVTGSVNQLGEIQPIGGVNEKVEGFFDVCATRGLTGTQGVLLPAANVEDLMLHSRVVAAVEKGQFHVFAAHTIDDGIEVLTGVAAGRREGGRRYPVESINGKVNARLRRMATLMRDFGGNP
jgi:ATP-dependent Lon protease